MERIVAEAAPSMALGTFITDAVSANAANADEITAAVNGDSPPHGLR